MRKERRKKKEERRKKKTHTLVFEMYNTKLLIFYR